MTEYTFDSKFRVGSAFQPDVVNDEFIKNEPMFFNSGLVYARDKGNFITRGFIDHFLYENPDVKPEDCVFDSRVHMLMKGWFPCIPGFHHDDVPRYTSGTGQPNYDRPAYQSQHVMGLVGGKIAPTEFAQGVITLPRIDDGIVYKEWHKQVEAAIEAGTMQRIPAPSSRLVYFDSHAFHQGVRAVDNGWRWFGRISWNTNRSKTVSNEIRRQVQVYLEHPMEGW